MEELVIEVERRSSTGKGLNKKLRQQGIIPAVVYGGGKEAVPVTIDRHAVTELLRQKKGRNTVFLLKMKGTKQERKAMVRDAQIDPVTQQFIHLDFIRVMEGQLVRVDVPLVILGESPGVKVGGFLDWVSRTLQIECAPDAIPASIPVDVGALEMNEHLTASELPLPDNVTLLDDLSKVIVVVATHGVKATAEEEAEAEAVAEAEEEEGTEPELIRKAKGAEERSK